MRDGPYTAYLEACGYTPKAVSSRVSRCRAVERRLKVDLDRYDLSVSGIAKLRELLRGVEANKPVLANMLNAARAYGRFRDGIPPSRGGRSSPSSSMSQVAAAKRSELVVNATVSELVSLYGDILDELRDRQVIRSANAPVGDYAEYLFSKAFGWKLNGKSTAHHDAVSPDRTRYQVKARRDLGGPGGRQLGIIRDLPARHFDTLAAVLFNRDMTVKRGALIPHSVVEARATFVRHVNGWRFMLTDDVCKVFGVEDVTDALRAAADQI